MYDCRSKYANDFFGKKAVFSPSRHISVLVYGDLRVLTASLIIRGDLTAFVLRPYGDQSRPYGF
ncbi:hypothetical protein DPMN_064490 [Dreissena polymorpha]|uniref:Uncharacterized protein n=1 Tax=Dreissena polymorpha TaxID=45954 RepID=A0A9D4CDG3_DREPO|nr:hypothetical protein DPMN_064490 [Dreissena polymorpha]